MANLRNGLFGGYYGSLYNESEPLSEAEMKTNASYIYSFLLNKGWSVNAIAGMLGNMESESSFNPGRWQNEDINNLSVGYGLVQWTPATNYIDWCNANGLTDPSEMDNNLNRILYEVENGLQWIPTDLYNYSFKDFSTSSASVSSLAKAFLLNYERPANQGEAVQSIRSAQAAAWYTYLTGVAPISDQDTTLNSKKKKFNFILFSHSRRLKQWTKNRF